jgi:hypothetical protein
MLPGGGRHGSIGCLAAQARIGRHPVSAMGPRRLQQDVDRGDQGHAPSLLDEFGAAGSTGDP